MFFFSMKNIFLRELNLEYLFVDKNAIKIQMSDRGDENNFFFLLTSTRCARTHVAFFFFFKFFVIIIDEMMRW